MTAAVSTGPINAHGRKFPSTMNEIFGKKEIPKPSYKTLDSLRGTQVISIILTQYLKNKMVVHCDDTKPRNNCLTKKFYMLPYAQHITHTQ